MSGNEREQSTPDLTAMRLEFQECIDNQDRNPASRAQTAHDTRFCRWVGQSEDGRKWTPRKQGEAIFPWPGASDARVPLCDMYVREDVAMLMVIWSRMRAILRPVEVGDAARARRMTEVLEWMRGQMPEAFREARLAADYLMERGKVVVGVFWDRRTQLGYETITMEVIRNPQLMAALFAQQGLQPAPDLIAALPALIMDESEEERLVPIVQEMLPELRGIDRCRQLIRDLREQGEARFPMAYTAHDRPTITAFAVGEDIFLPPESTNIEDARCIYWLETVTETTLQERARDGWDQGFVDEVIEKTRGKRIMESTVTSSTRNRGNTLAESRTFEICHGYRRTYDGDGVPGIWYTVFSPHLAEADCYGSHQLLNYDHGGYPFVEIELEVVSRRLDDARGYGEMLATPQRQVKTQWDARTDRTSLATLPPSYAPTGRAPEHWSPGEIIETSRPDAYGFLQPPRFDGGSSEIEGTIRAFTDRYMSRPTEGGNPVDAQTGRQYLGNIWMEGWQRIDRQIWQLMQQFMPERFAFRVVGEAGDPIHATREEIQGQFDLTIGFDVGDLGSDYAKEKLGLVETMLKLDSAGIIDRAAALSLAADLIDPNIGRRLIRPAQAVTGQEIEDERAVFSQLLSGVQVDIKPGQNYGLRLQVLEGLVKNNPTAQRLLAQDPHIAEVVMNRQRQLTQQIQQEQNKLIGVYGATPSAQGPNPLTMMRQ